MNIGSYEIVRQIGEGGFARTYEAKHLLLRTRACVKQNLKVTDIDTALLKQEARLMWDIHHYSLPSIKDFFPVGDGSHAIAMTFVEGKNLEEIITKHTAIHPEDVCWMTQRLLNALHYLHSNGIVHSDVKPQNIIVQPNIHNIVLVDYGLSAFRPKSDTSPIGYTEAYAAPELLQGKPPLPESDLYGVGIVMLYGLGGDILSKSIPAGTPEPIRKFCDQLLLYNPIDRPNWEKVDIIKQLSDIRQEVFGRRHSV